MTYCGPGLLEKDYKMATMKRVFIILVLCLIPALARADEIYTYSGPAPADLSGSFTTEDPIVATTAPFGFLNAGFSSVPIDWGNFMPGVTIESFKFTDGVDVWASANSVLGGIACVNPDGTFALWSFVISVGDDRVARSLTEFGNFYDQDTTPVGDSWVANQYSFDKPKGSFTISDGDHDGDDPVSTPEPGTLALLGVGLAGLLARKTK
jgi:hypothetical protein